MACTHYAICEDCCSHESLERLQDRVLELEAMLDGSPDALIAWARRADAASIELLRRMKSLSDFREFFSDKCEHLFAEFGMEAIDLYNKAALAARRQS